MKGLALEGGVVMLKDQSSFPSRGFWIALLGGIMLLAFLAFPGPGTLRKAEQRAKMAKAVSDAKQIKLSMDSFAMDNSGVYPNRATALKYECPDDGSSNALFRQ
jgi:hypothetical protein